MGGLFGWVIGVLLLFGPVLLAIGAVAWRNEVLAKRIGAHQAELKFLLGQAMEEAARGRALGAEKSFVAWRVEWARDGVMRVENTGSDKARSVTAKAWNASGSAEKTVSSVEPGASVNLGVVLAAADDTEVELTWRTELGRWTTERYVAKR
ncbi:hypothetical protein [Mycobacterium sp. DL440]|uniref:hypothetical protein n=1 Tax=Mycobacterium sp. DL440 TaxID=2675523 RepID=UPI0014203780|nr:hypothetical protein [Mycobacterium sp. DL440]